MRHSRQVDLLQLIHRFLRGGQADLAQVVPRLERGVAQDLLLGGGELVPEYLADQDDVRCLDVVGRADVLLDFVELVRADHVERVFLPVDGLGFQCRAQLAEAQRHGRGLERLEALHEHRVQDDAQLEHSVHAIR